MYNPTEAQLSSVSHSIKFKNHHNEPKSLELLSFSLRSYDSNVVLKLMQQHIGVGRTQFQSITPTEAQLSSVICSMNFENDQDGPKSFELLSSSQDIITPMWSSSQTNSIWLLGRLRSIHIPRKVQLSNEARRIDFKNDQNKSKFL